jgi:hypothetical protein
VRPPRQDNIFLTAPVIGHLQERSNGP